MEICLSVWLRHSIPLRIMPSFFGRPRGFKISIRDITASVGAGFLVALAGDIMKMPGLPKVPALKKSMWMKMDLSQDYSKMENDDMMLDKKVTEFLDVLSSNEPVPGGGGASATVGAMGSPLELWLAT